MGDFMAIIHEIQGDPDKKSEKLQGWFHVIQKMMTDNDPQNLAVNTP